MTGAALEILQLSFDVRFGLAVERRAAGLMVETAVTSSARSNITKWHGARWLERRNEILGRIIAMRTEAIWALTRIAVLQGSLPSVAHSILTDDLPRFFPLRTGISINESSLACRGSIRISRTKARSASYACRMLTYTWLFLGKTR